MDSRSCENEDEPCIDQKVFVEWERMPRKLCSKMGMLKRVKDPSQKKKRRGVYSSETFVGKLQAWGWNGIGATPAMQVPWTSEQMSSVFGQYNI